MVRAVEPSSLELELNFSVAGFSCAAAARQTFKLNATSNATRLAPSKHPNSFFMKSSRIVRTWKGRYFRSYLENASGVRACKEYVWHKLWRSRGAGASPACVSEGSHVLEKPIAGLENAALMR